MIIIKLIFLSATFAAVFGGVSLYLKNLHNTIKCRAVRCNKLFVKNFLRKRRHKNIQSQLTDGIDLIRNAVRSGLGLQQAFSIASEEISKPLSEEFRAILDEVRLGVNFDDAISNFKKRIPLEDVQIFAESILILRSTGGNLAETFSSISKTIRERQKIKGKIDLMTVEGMTQACLLLTLPFFLAAGLYFVSPWYIKPLFEEPTGLALITAALTFQATGALWIRKIVRIKV